MYLNQPGPKMGGTEDRFRSAEDQGLDFMRRAGCENLQQMRALTPEQILQAFTQMEAAGSYNSRAPVDGWVLPDEIRNIFARGEHNDVPLIAGSNADEMTSLTDPRTHPATLDDLKKFIESEYEGGADAFLAVYPAASDADVRRAYLDSQRDARFTLNMRGWLQGAARGASPAYQYFFTRQPRNAQQSYFRAYHAAEIAYVFDNLQGIAARTQIEPADEALADAMSAYWVNFAKSGDPNGEGLPRWPRYTAEEAGYLELGDEIKAGAHLLKPQLDYTAGAMRAR